jgi:hypothetical protein
MEPCALWITGQTREPQWLALRWGAGDEALDIAIAIGPDDLDRRLAAWHRSSATPIILVIDITRIFLGVLRKLHELGRLTTGDQTLFSLIDQPAAPKKMKGKARSKVEG